MAGHCANDPPTHLRVNGSRTYKVDWIRDVRKPVAADDVPEGSLLATIEAYSDDADETLTAVFRVSVSDTDPELPDWTSMQSTSCPAPLTDSKRQLSSPMDARARSLNGGDERRLAHSPEGLINPSWRRSRCLACRRPIVRARDAHFLIAGTLSGSWVVVWPSAPDQMAVTGPLPLSAGCHCVPPGLRLVISCRRGGVTSMSAP